MKQEEKELLKKVICEMLPYGVRIAKGNVIYPMTGINIALGYVELAVSERISIEDVRPYLRPMSSMTEEEYNEIFNESGFDTTEINNGIVYAETLKIPIEFCGHLIDWLNAHYFDYLGLIPMGLALEAPEGMYDFK